jgi:hypothetical protein
MDAAGRGRDTTSDVSARGGKFEAMGKQMRLVFLPGNDVDVARLGDEIAAAIPRPFGREIAFLHTEGPALICNPVDQEQYPLMESIGRGGGSRFLHDEDSVPSG